MNNLSATNQNIDITVIGAGVIGLAIARQLALSSPSLTVAVIEQEKKSGTGISSRNSEVIHAGLYYPKYYLKTELCVTGNRLLYEYCATHKVPHRRIGKIIVANTDAEHEFLHALSLRAEINGISDLTWLTKKKLAELEPAVRAQGSFLSPSTGIIDAARLVQSLEKDASDAGVHLILNTRINHIASESQGFALTCHASDNTHTPYTYHTRVLVNAAGLQTGNIAKSIHSFPLDKLPTMVLAKGDYFSYSGKNPFRHLIYPLPAGQPMTSPNTQHTSLGIHATIDMQGHLRFGPDITIVDKEDYCVDESKREFFAETIRQYFPALDKDKLQPAYAGIRPRLPPSNNTSVEKKTPDFLIQTEQQHGLPGLINLLGIESPGLTCCLSIALSVSQHIENVLR